VRQSCGEAEYEFFLLVEMGTRFKLPDVLKLLLSDSLFSADGRVNVNSKRAAHHERYFDLRQLLQVRGNRAWGDAVKIQTDGVA
jgi:hypothetical protein